MSLPAQEGGTRAAGRVRIFALIAAVALIIVAGCLWWSWSARQSSSSQPPGSAESPANSPQPDGSVVVTLEQLRAQGVETAPVMAATAMPVEGLPAQTVAPLSASAQVVAPYGGVVTRVLVDEGATVRQGQALARIQSREVLTAQADLAKARSEAAAAAAQARRDAALLAEGIIPASRNEQTQARAAAAQSTLQGALGALSRLRPVQGGQPGEYELLAPLSGQVVRRHVSSGQAVAPLDIAFAVAESGPLDVVFSAPLRLRPDLHSGLSVRLPDGSTARVVAMGGDADLDSQSIRVRARLEADNAGKADKASTGRYVAGQQISVTLLLPAESGTLSVPSSALLPAAGRQVVYVAEPAPAAQAGGLRIHAVPVQLLGQDEAQSSSVVRALPSGSGAASAPVSTASSAPAAAAPLAAGMQVVVRGTALLKSIVPLP